MKKILAIIMAVAMMATLSTALFAVDAVEKIEGDLTVTSFFNEKTNAVELKTGETLTLKFHDKSNGTDQWTNFVLAITGAIGEAYTGANEEVLIIRADSWGWGGGMSDFVAPDGDGNKLAFTNNVDDWVGGFQAAMKEGADVEVTLTRDGNKLSYEMKTGDYTVSLEATSGKDLPETLYVFLTGENVELTGITSEKGAAAPSTDAPAQTGEGEGGEGGDTPAPTGKPETEKAPSTGFATIALAIAAIGSGAYVVSKKH